MIEVNPVFATQKDISDFKRYLTHAGGGRDGQPVIPPEPPLDGIDQLYGLNPLPALDFTNVLKWSVTN